MVRQGSGALLAALSDISVVGNAPGGQAAVTAVRQLTRTWC
jgi:hypothetical protein